MVCKKEELENAILRLSDYATNPISIRHIKMAVSILGNKDEIDSFFKELKNNPLVFENEIKYEQNLKTDILNKDDLSILYQKLYEFLMASLD